MILAGALPGTLTPAFAEEGVWSGRKRPSSVRREAKHFMRAAVLCPSYRESWNPSLTVAHAPAVKVRSARAPAIVEAGKMPAPPRGPREILDATAEMRARQGVQRLLGGAGNPGERHHPGSTDAPMIRNYDDPDAMREAILRGSLEKHRIGIPSDGSRPPRTTPRRLPS